VENFAKLQQRIPERIIEKAVKGMLPKGTLGRLLFTHMKVVKGPEHEHSAQQPVDITDQINRNFTTQNCL
jgi:large subunit ribosomal protein L13